MIQELILLINMNIMVVMWKRNQPRDRSLNAQTESDWRIHRIPYESFSYKQTWKSGWAASPTGSFLSLAGIILFVGGICLTVAKNNLSMASFSCCVIGFPLLLLGILIANRDKRRDWIRIEGACLDREHRRIPFIGVDGGSGFTWAFRLLCRIN